MAGWFVDIWVEYLVRSVLGIIQRVRARSWPIVDACITSSSCPRASYGCHVAEIQYDYTAGGEGHWGTHKKPFLFLASGEAYTKRLSPGVRGLVKYNPKEPASSILIDPGA
jgi:hypothetical protein